MGGRFCIDQNINSIYDILYCANVLEIRRLHLFSGQSLQLYNHINGIDAINVQIFVKPGLRAYSIRLDFEELRHDIVQAFIYGFFGVHNSYFDKLPRNAKVWFLIDYHFHLATIDPSIIDGSDFSHRVFAQSVS